MSGVSFSYNNPQFLGQTVFIKRGENQGKMGQVVREDVDDYYQVSLGDFGNEKLRFHRSDFLVYRYRKVRMPVTRT